MVAGWGAVPVGRIAPMPCKKARWKQGAGEKGGVEDGIMRESLLKLRTVSARDVAQSQKPLDYLHLVGLFHKYEVSEARA